MHKLAITGLSLNLISYIIAILCNKEKNLNLYFIYCAFTGASIGVYGTTTYIILFNKCNGILEIIGLGSIFEFFIQY